MSRFSGRSTPMSPPAAPTPATAPEPASAPAPIPGLAALAKEPAPEASYFREDGLLDARLKLHARLIDEIDLSKLDKLEDKEMRRQVRGLVADFAREERLPLNGVEIEQLGVSVFDEMVGLGPIEPLLQDDTIADILINGPFKVFIERHGELELTPVRFKDNDHLLRIVNRIVAGVGRRIDEFEPDGRRAPGRRQPGERRHLSDRHRRRGGLDPEVLQETL